MDKEEYEKNRKAGHRGQGILPSLVVKVTPPWEVESVVPGGRKLYRRATVAGRGRRRRTGR